VRLPLTASCPDKRDFVIEEFLRGLAADVAKARAPLAGARREAARAVAASALGPPLLVLGRLAATGPALAALSVAERNAARAAPTTVYQKRLVRTYPPTSTGRRLALARWIADRANPLAARVAMNHLWLRHFGKGIVPTEFDFGHNGRPATHPALLDWLAA